MRKPFKAIVTSIVLLFVANFSQVQIKIGYIDFQGLLKPYKWVLMAGEYL